MRPFCFQRFRFWNSEFLLTPGRSAERSSTVKVLGSELYIDASSMGWRFTPAVSSTRRFCSFMRTANFLY